MAKFSLSVVGIEDLKTALAALPKATQKNTLQRVLMTAGKPIQQEAQRRAPERAADAPTEYYRVAGGGKRVRRPGTLKAIVEIGTRLTPNQAKQQRRSDDPNFANVYIGTRDPMGRLEEFGTMHARPTPFMRPAWEGGKEQALKTIEDQLAVEIEKSRARYAKRLAKKAAAGM